jgi:cytochrome c oxidase subunit II
MWPSIPLIPDRASTVAGGVDALYYFLTAVTVVFTVGIFLAILILAVKYRRRSEDEKPPEIEGSLLLEITWTVIPSAIAAVMFVWGAVLYVQNARPPRASTEVFAIGKQWMWHLQHAEGPREINELHIPVNVPIKVTMTSQDVIHDFYIPAFRVKKDVLPGRYTSLWFEATKTGAYHLFCAQYCGTEHAAMIGTVYVMDPGDYEAWLSGNPRGETMEAAGERMFSQYGCITCHAMDGTGRAPSLKNVYGKQVRLENGQTVLADESYVRESIVTPFKKIVKGYTPIMPTFEGQLNEQQILELITYVKSLASQEGNTKK